MKLQKSAVDFILNQYLANLQATATRIGLGLSDTFWSRAVNSHHATKHALNARTDTDLFFRSKISLDENARKVNGTEQENIIFTRGIDISQNYLLLTSLSPSYSILTALSITSKYWLSFT
jgi:hypothetical protein